VTRRIDDLALEDPTRYSRNDPYVDKVRFDANGDIIERVQTKFVGKNGEECLSKLMSKKYEKYIYDGKVDKIEIPKDYYEEIKNSGSIERRRQKLQKQLERVTSDGKTDVTHQIEARIEKLDRVEKMIEPSTVTMTEAIEGVTHPTRTTGKLFMQEAKYVGTEAAKSGLVAAGITLAVSTVDNVSSFVDGEITAEEMVTDIVTETAAAGAIEYGSELISAGVSQAMSKSSSALVQKVAGTCAPAAVVSFAVESYDSVSAFAKGEIDGSELAYELGENAASVAGAIKGQAAGAAVGLAVGGPVGAVAGGIVGGVVGAAVASEMYATAVEVAAEGIEQLAETAEGLMQDTVELFTEHIPEKLEEVKTAFTDFVTEFDLPFHI